MTLQLLEMLRGRDVGTRSDPILRIASLVLDLEEDIVEAQEGIAKESIVEIAEDGTVKVVAVKSEARIYSLQSEIKGKRAQITEAISYMTRIEEAFKNAGISPRGMNQLRAEFDELCRTGDRVAIKINQRVLSLIAGNRAITLPEIFADLAIQQLEGERGRVLLESQKEIKRVRALLEEANTITNEAAIVLGR